MLQCVVVCCSVLQCAAVCCSVLQCVTVCCSVLQCAAVRCAPRGEITGQNGEFLNGRRIRRAVLAIFVRGHDRLADLVEMFMESFFQKEQQIEILTNRDSFLENRWPGGSGRDSRKDIF